MTYRELIDFKENKMKTDAKTMVEVLRKVADNIESGLNKNNGIQAMYGNNEWKDRTANDLCFVENVKYRIKPETIILKNGVTIPKPLSIDELQEGTLYHFPTLTKYLYDSCYRDWLIENEVAFVYATKEEAIEASKKLFGIE